MGNLFASLGNFLAENPNIVTDVYHGAVTIISMAREAFNAPAPMPAPLSPDFTEEEIAAKRRIARERLHMNIETDFNVAFCGQVKAGKSRMINAIRGVKKGQAGYAQTGNLQCSEQIEPYRFMDGTNANLVLWDCPGAGQPGQDIKTYFEQNMLYAFDCLMIFLLETVREGDLEYAAEAYRHGVPFAFVRSKCDVNLRERVEDGSTLETAKTSFVQDNRKFYSTLIKEGGDALADAPLFFVSATVIEKSTPQTADKNKLEEDKLFAFVVNSALSRRGCFPQQ